MNLRMIAERIQTSQPEADRMQSPRQADEADSLEIEEENCSAVNLSSNVTRKYQGLKRLPKHLVNKSVYRLFGRVFSLEFLTKASETGR